MTGKNAGGLGGNVTGTLAATGTTPAYVPDKGGFNIDVSGAWTGSWKLQRSWDDGVTWADYTLADQTFNPTTNASTELNQAEKWVQWRINATLSAGSLVYRLSQ